MSENMHTDICDRPVYQSGSAHYIYPLCKHLLYFFASFKAAWQSEAVTRAAEA